MKTNYLTVLILCLSIPFTYSQQKQSGAKASISASKKTISEKLVLKPYDGGIGMWGYKNAKTGKIVIEPAYYEAAPFSNGLALVATEKSKYGFINMQGEEIIPLIYDGGFPFTEGLAAVNKGKGSDANDIFLAGKWGFIDNKGNEMIPFNFTDAKSFSQGVAAVAVDEIWGFIDRAGNEIIPKKYGQVGSFSEGLACVYNFEKWGYIDILGATIIPFRYDFAQSFKNGKAEVEINGKSYYIDTKGKRFNK